jgi:hypothetical protein
MPAGIFWAYEKLEKEEKFFPEPEYDFSNHPGPGYHAAFY